MYSVHNNGNSLTNRIAEKRFFSLHLECSRYNSLGFLRRTVMTGSPFVYMHSVQYSFEY